MLVTDDAKGASAHPDPRLHWLGKERLRLYSILSLIISVLYFASWAIRAHLLNVVGILPPGGDFVVFWSAAQVAMTGDPAAVYDVAVLQKVEFATVPLVATGNGMLPWLYPPTFLLFVLPLGLMPYSLAVPVFLGGCTAFYLWVVSRIVPWAKAWLPCAAFPGIAIVLATGQNSLLLAGCGGLALTLLRSRPILAGILMGLLTVKPHLALVFPVALVCAKAWRALAAMIIAALMLAAVSLGAFGPASFAAFLGNAELARSGVESGAFDLARMPTVFAAARMLRASVPVSYALHAAIAVGAISAIVYAWSRPCSFGLQASALITATLLVPPYLYDYDLAFVGLVVAWLGTHGYRNGWLHGERELLIYLWLLPLGGFFVVKSIGIQFMPAVTAFALIHITRRIYLERTGADEAARRLQGRG